MPELPLSIEERLAALEAVVNKLKAPPMDLLLQEGYLQLGSSNTNGSHRFNQKGYQLANNGADGFGVGAAGMWFVPYLHPEPQIGSAGVYPQTVMSGFARESDGQTQLTLRGQTALNDNVFIAQFIANPTTASIQLEVDSASNDGVTLVLESPDTGDPAAYIQVGSDIYNLLGGGGMSVKVKEADETVTTSTTLQNDDELLFAVAANEVWQFEGVLNISTGAAADFRFSFTGPTGAVGSFSGIYTDLAGAQDGAMDDLGSAEVVIGGNGGLLRFWGGIHNGANAGNLTLQWAQGTSDASNTVVKAGSYIKWQANS